VDEAGTARIPRFDLGLSENWLVYINLDNAMTVTRNDVADRIAGRGPNKYLERNCDSI
jgi:hypothetical protein